MHAALSACPTQSVPTRPRRPRVAGPTPLPATSAPGRLHLGRLVAALVEVITGRRAGAQLAPVLTYPMQAALRALPRQPPTTRVKTIHLSEVDPVTVELVAVLDLGKRVKALAARVEHTGQRWCFTALHLVGG